MRVGTIFLFPDFTRGIVTAEINGKLYIASIDDDDIPPGIYTDNYHGIQYTIVTDILCE